jgi:hypothetical protein
MPGNKTAAVGDRTGSKEKTSHDDKKQRSIFQFLKRKGSDELLEHCQKRAKQTDPNETSRPTLMRGSSLNADTVTKIVVNNSAPEVDVSVVGIVNSARLTETVNSERERETAESDSLTETVESERADCNENSVTVILPPQQSFLIGNCVDKERFKKWQLNRPWLQYNAKGQVYCSFCSSSKKLGVNTEKSVRIDPAFINGVVANCAKKLNDKITNHGSCRSHELCEKAKQRQEKKEIEKGMERSSSLWREQNEQEFKTTSRIFRTAYTICKSNFSFRSNPELVNLQSLNGLDMGKMLYSDHSCKNMLCFVSEEMKKTLASYIIESEEMFSLMFDESTTCSNKSCVILYIRVMYENEPCNFLFSVLQLESATGEVVLQAVLNELEAYNINDSVLKKQLVGVATDGAAAMQGCYKGATTLLKKRLGTNIVIVHCMNHKLELAVNDVVRSNNIISHLAMFMDTLYSVFSQSPKNAAELEAVSNELGSELFKARKLFSIRWLASSYESISAIWNSYPGFVEFFERSSSDTSRSSKERAKFIGLANKMKTPEFVMELALLKEALQVLKSFSLYLQKRDSSAIEVESELKEVIKQLSVMEHKNPACVKEAEPAVKDGIFKGVKINELSPMKEEIIMTFRKKIIQALVDNIERRFENRDFIKSASVLSPSQWPENDDEKLFFGDEKIQSLCESVRFQVPVHSIVKDFRKYKENKCISEDLQTLINRIKVVPISTSECERGFSGVNLTLTDIRNRMDIKTLRALLFLNINGPPLHAFPAEAFAEKWIKGGHHSANDTPRGIKPPEKIVPHSCKIFL